MTTSRRVSLEDIAGDIEQAADALGNRLQDMKHDANWIMDEANKLEKNEDLLEEVRDSMREIADVAAGLIRAMG